MIHNCCQFGKTGFFVKDKYLFKRSKWFLLLTKLRSIKQNSILIFTTHIYAYLIPLTENSTFSVFESIPMLMHPPTQTLALHLRAHIPARCMITQHERLVKEHNWSASAACVATCLKTKPQRFEITTVYRGGSRCRHTEGRH